MELTILDILRPAKGKGNIWNRHIKKYKGKFYFIYQLGYNMLHIHYNKVFDIDEVVDDFAKTHSRKMELGSLLKNWFCHQLQVKWFYINTLFVIFVFSWVIILRYYLYQNTFYDREYIYNVDKVLCCAELDEYCQIYHYMMSKLYFRYIVW